MRPTTTVICDLDGTLFNIDHRLHYLEKKDWDGFFGAVKDDTPNAWCVELVRAMARAGHEIIFVSGRNESARPATEEWMRRLGLDTHWLFMRPEKSRQPDYELKEAFYEHEIKDKKNVLFVVEDRKQVVDMWRSKGLTVLHCEEGEF